MRVSVRSAPARSLSCSPGAFLTWRSASPSDQCRTFTRSPGSLSEAFMIKHLPGPFPTRSRAVIHEGHVHAVSFVTNKKPDMYLQTKSALAHIDATLKEAGTDKRRILKAIVY